MSDAAPRDRLMPWWVMAGVFAILGGVFLTGPVRLLLWVAGACAIAYGVGQYLGPRRR